MKHIKNFTHICLTIVFLYMAVMQLNDPDPLYWVVVYTLVAFFPLSHLLRQTMAKYATFVLGMVVAGLLMSGPGFVEYIISQDYGSLVGKMTMNKSYVEFAREFLGLLIAAAGIIFYTVFLKNVSKKV